MMRNTQEIYFAGGFHGASAWSLRDRSRPRQWGSTDSLQSAYDGYAECVHTTFDPAEVTLQQLIEYFFEIIDPFSLNRQGKDAGPKYRTGIYSTDSTHLQQAKAYINSRKDASQIAVEILPLTNYVTSAAEHQGRLTRCHIPKELLHKYRRKSGAPSFSWSTSGTAPANDS